VRRVQLTDTSWRARADFDRRLTQALDAFLEAGGRVEQ